MRKPCTHKIPRDFQRASTTDGRAVWVCSNCDKQSTWEPGWRYYGSIECARGAYGMRGCGWPAIEYVACSDRCAKELAS